MKISNLEETVKIPEGVTVKIEGSIITATGPHGVVKRSWNEPNVSIKVQGNEIKLQAKNASKKQKRVLQTMKSQASNAVNGTKNNNEYKLKVCSSHFPMQVSIEGQNIVVKNFFGEKVPRKTTLSKDVKVQVQGDKVIVSGPDVETVGETASRIEQLCRIANRDRRAFQDGIFLIEKNGKAI